LILYRIVAKGIERKERPTRKGEKWGISANTRTRGRKKDRREEKKI
jgi:hypothetical protein